MRRPAPATVRRLILVLILVLWEVVPRTGLLAELFLPSLSKTLTVLVAARSMGASLLQQITRVVIPASIPTVLAGLRLGGALAIIGVVVSEMLTSAAGIGYLVSKYRTVLDSPRVFAAILMILVLSVLF